MNGSSKPVGDEARNEIRSETRSKTLGETCGKPLDKALDKARNETCDDARNGALRLGVVSDSHGLLREEVLRAMQGCARILHLGDVGDDAILDALAAIAPLTAVRGNVDRAGRCGRLPETEIVSERGATLYLLHDRQTLDLKPEAAGFAAVLSGHSHQPLVEWRNGVLYLNPGACGPRRFRLPISCAWLDVESDGRLSPTLLTLTE